MGVSFSGFPQLSARFIFWVSVRFILVIGVGFVVLAAGMVLIFFLPFRACRRSKLESEQSGGIMYSIPYVMARKFSFNEIQTLTNSFGKVLGSGGFRIVYEGVLEDGTIVFVKRLEIARQGEKEFYAEVGILGIVHHWNLVQLLGFCAQGLRMILIYDHMPIGSLDQWLFD